MARRRLRLLQPVLFSVSLTFFIVLASLIIPLRQKPIRWPSIWNVNSGVRSFSSKMTLPTHRLKDGNSIPAVSIAQLVKASSLTLAFVDRLWNRHSMV